MLKLRRVSKLSLVSSPSTRSASPRSPVKSPATSPQRIGKSTTMHMIAGLIEATSARSCSTVFRSPQSIAWKQQLGYVSEEPHLYPHLSGLEYLTMVGQLRNLPSKTTSDQIDGLLRLFSLHQDRHLAISSYSKGMRQKVLLSAALMHNPDLILLDEPFSGLDVATGLVLRGLLQSWLAVAKSFCSALMNSKPSSASALM